MKDTLFYAIGAAMFMSAALGFIVGIGVGVNDGQVQVASGQYACALVAKSDKTTEWKCTKVEGAK